MSVPKIEINDFYTLRHVMESSTLTEIDKLNLVINNADNIKSIMQVELGTDMYNKIMSDKPLLRHHPFKNALNKKVDDVLIGQVLNIKPTEVKGAIQNITEAMKTADRNHLPLAPDKLLTVKTYVYKHGSQEQLAVFFNFELKKSINLDKTLHKTMEYNNGGIADYFSIPIHRMKNETFVSLYNIITDHINQRLESGKITSEEAAKISEWTIKQLYVLQQNSRFIRPSKSAQGK